MVLIIKSKIKKITSSLEEFLSSYSELHAFTHGIYSGLVEWKGIKETMWEDVDCNTEPHYVKGGYILGTLIRWGFIINLAIFI